MNNEDNLPLSDYDRSDSSNVPFIGKAFLAVYLLGLTLLFLYILFIIWPVDKKPETVTKFFGYDLNVETQYFLIAAMSGALGSLLIAIQSYMWYLGNGALKKSWGFLYFAKPISGATFGTFIYLAFRGGFLNIDSSANGMNPYTIGAVAFFSGLFADNILLYLKKSAEMRFGKVGLGKDACPRE